MGLCFLRLYAKSQLNWTCFGLVIANFKLGFVWMMFCLAKFCFSQFGSQINWIVFSEVACKILAQSDLI